MAGPGPVKTVCFIASLFIAWGLYKKVKKKKNLLEMSDSEQFAYLLSLYMKEKERSQKDAAEIQGHLSRAIFSRRV
jgi:hypothetical protein